MGIPMVIWESMLFPPPPHFFFIWREMICSLSNFNEVKFIKNKIKSIPHVLLNQMKGLRSDYLPSFFNFYFFFLLTAKNLAKGLGHRPGIRSFTEERILDTNIDFETGY